VELNPARAGIVKEPRDYRWSSYRAYAYEKKDSLVDEDPIYWRRSKDVIRGEMGGRVIYCSEVFAGKLKKAYEMEEMIKPIARLKKEPK